MNIVAVVVGTVMMAVLGRCQGEVFKVGGASGWTTINITSDFYRKWAASQDFKVGDTILFQYNNNFHNVIRVTHKNYNDCNATAPYATWNSGNDSFVIPRKGHFYFFCSFHDHCHTGQKIDIRVVDRPSPSPHHASPPTHGVPSLPPQGSPSSPEGPPSPGPSSPDEPSFNAPAPAPTQKSEASTFEVCGKLLAAAVVAFGAVIAY